MKFNLSQRITLGYLFIIVVALFATIYCVVTLQHNKELDEQIQATHLPLYLNLKDLSVVNKEAAKLTNHWIYQPDKNEKQALTLLLHKEYPQVRSNIQKALAQSGENNVEPIKSIMVFFDTIAHAEDIVMARLHTDSLYSDGERLARTGFFFNKAVSPLADELDKKLQAILNDQQDQIDDLQEAKESADTFLSFLLMVMMVVFILAVLVVYLYVQRTIVNPIIRVKDMIVALSLGKTVDLKVSNRTDEIGHMMLAMNNLTQTISIKSEFARQIGNGNYNAHFELLSQEDVMGRALLDMRDNLKRSVEEKEKRTLENKRLAMVANNTTNVVILADCQGGIEWVNAAFTRITGYQAQEVLGKNLEFLIQHAEAAQDMLAFGKRMIQETQGFKDVEFINYTKEGIPYWVSVEVLPIADKSGKIVQFIVIGTDIHDRKTAQKALEDRNKELEKSNSELDRFVYSASHDLRAPIASLLGLIEVARLEKDIHTVGELLNKQKKALLRLDHFIRDIINYSRNARLQVEPELVDFEHMAHTMLEQFQFMENISKIRKVVAVHQSGKFYTSPTRVNMVLSNLISNAIKYADLQKEDPFLKILIKSTADHAEIRVCDNGEGIPEDAREKIFNMFYRASEKGSGSGLGLYIVKEALQKIGGSIMVQSEYGKRTEFLVTIPGRG